MKRPKREGASNKRIAGRTVGGRSALHALRHGIFLREPVIPGVESVREFRRFKSKFIEAMAPRNALHRWLAMRIVGLAWRLNRVEMFEAAVIERGQPRAEDEPAAVVEQMGQDLLERVLKGGRSHLELLTRLPHLAPETKVRGSEVLEVLEVVADWAGVKLEDVMDLSMAEDLASWPNHPLCKDWIPAEILEMISAIAHRAGEDPEGLRQGAVRRLMTVFASGEAEAKAVAAARDHQRRLRLLPDSEELNRVVRFEAHLWRLLARAFHEYEALQPGDERVP
jgi:hypothetical protein